MPDSQAPDQASDQGSDPRQEEHPHAASHGNTPAAWTGVVVGLLGFVVGGIGLMFSPVSYAVFCVGVGLVVLAGVLWIVMDRMGFGEH